MGYVLGSWGSFHGGGKVFLFSLSSRAHPSSYAIGTSEPFWRGGSIWGMKLITHMHLSPGSRMTELSFHSPIFLHGIVQIIIY
jgi:hypothetical protein